MSRSRHINEFRPLVESGYASTVRCCREQDGAGADWSSAQHIQDHHVTLRIDVANLARQLLEKARDSKTDVSKAFGGAVSLKINTTKERE